MARSLSRGARYLVVFMLAVAWFAGIGSRVLQHPDEGRYAEIAREMARTGDWLTPRLNDLKYFEKPPLQYWITAAAFDAFGVREWTARLWPALAGLLTVAVVGVAATRLAGGDVGWLAAMAFAAMVWPTGMAQFLNLDTALDFWLAAALACFLVAQRDGTERAAERRWMAAAWAAAAGAVLTKGLVGLAIPGGTLVLYSLVARDFAVWRRLHLGVGLVVLLILAAPWFVAVSRANPEFAPFFFVHEHFQRFLEPGHRREGAWWYFLPVLAAGILPWLLLAPVALPRAWREGVPARNGFSWPRFCLVWAAFVLAFFSASSSKLPSYILPMFPALALPIGWQLARLPTRTLVTATAPLAATSALLLAGCLAGWDTLVARLPADATVRSAVAAARPWAVAACAVATIAGIAALAGFRRGTPRGRAAAVAALAIGTTLAVQAGFAGHDALRVTRSAADILAAARASEGTAFDERAPFFQVHAYDQTLPFYLGRPTPLVAFRDEFALGLDAEPAKGYASDAAWATAWNALPQGYALVRLEDLPALAAAGIPMREVARDPRRVIVARR